MNWWRDDQQPVKKRRRPRHLEDDEQRSLFHWLRAVRWKDRPLTKYAWHCWNGGKRNPKEAARMVGLGVKPGVPDVTMAIARHSFHGLYIELKVGNNRLTDSQKEVQSMLIEEGYCVRLAYSWHEAARFVCDYLDLPENVRPWSTATQLPEGGRPHEDPERRSQPV